VSAAIQELRFALRGLIKSPVLTGVAILTLGLGIGMTALMFSLVYGALFRGLPFPEEGRIIRVGWIQPSAPDAWRALSVYDYAQLKAGQKSLVHLAGVYTGTVNLAGIGLKLVLHTAVTSPPPFWFVFKIDAPILLFVMGASALAALVAGVVPGLRVIGIRANEILKDESRGCSSVRVGRLSRLLVMAELALSVGLLVPAGLFVKGMVKMRSLDHGIFQEDVLTARVGQRAAPDEARTGTASRSVARPAPSCCYRSVRSSAGVHTRTSSAPNRLV